MKKYWISFGIVVTVLLILTAIITGGSDGSSVVVSEKPRDPMTGKTEFNIPVQDPTRVDAGEALYRASCAACHGTDLRGTAVGPSHLSIIYNPEHHSDAGFAAAVSSGVVAHHWQFGNMPAITALTDEDLLNIMAYIRENQRVQGFEAYPPK